MTAAAAYRGSCQLMRWRKREEMNSTWHGEEIKWEYSSSATSKAYVHSLNSVRRGGGGGVNIHEFRFDYMKRTLQVSRLKNGTKERYQNEVTAWKENVGGEAGGFRQALLLFSQHYYKRGDSLGLFLKGNVKKTRVWLRQKRRAAKVNVNKLRFCSILTTIPFYG